MENTIDKELAELEQKINAENAKTQSTPESQAPEPVAATPTPQPEPVQPEPSQPSVNQDEFDAKQWVEKKGWKSAEDAAKSMRSLEQEYHKKNEELKQLKAQQGYQPQYMPPEPQYAPPPPPAYIPQPSYAPPANPYNPYQPRVTEEQIAASYNLPVEDFRKVVAVSRDLNEAQNRLMQAQFDRRIEELSRQSEKSSDMAQVASDPAFHNPDVQYEMHEILSKNPTVFNERRPYSAALKEALVNIGRKNATRGASSQPSTLPTEPPKAVGNSASSFSGKRSGGMSPVDFSKLSLEEQEKQLKGMKAFRTYEDMAG